MASAPNSRHDDTIYALSSGPLPAAIAIVRISGPSAGQTLDALVGRRPRARQASLQSVRSLSGEVLDRAIILWFPGPATATGEDLAELHLHGSRAVLDAVYRDLSARGLRLAHAGEFTRRALLNGRLDLSEAEGLADLLAAETEMQRREALQRTGGVLARKLEMWATMLLDLSVRLEAAIDYDGDDEVIAWQADIERDVRTLTDDLNKALSLPSAERLRDGLRVVIVGPPNSGKSTLFNAILGQEAAIVSGVAGTTRDVLERPIAIAGLPFILVDTAGVREADDPIEREGVVRARQEIERADLLLSLAEEFDAGVRPPSTPIIRVAAKADVVSPRHDAFAVCARSGEGMSGLIGEIARAAKALLPMDGEVALDRRYREGLKNIRDMLADVANADDAVLVAEEFRTARSAMSRLTGRGGVEDLLDALFGRFCLGK